MPTYLLRKNGKRITPPLISEGEAFRRLLDCQPMSATWAMKHEGYTIEVAPSGKGEASSAELAPNAALCREHQVVVPADAMALSLGGTICPMVPIHTSHEPLGYDDDTKHYSYVRDTYEYPAAVDTRG